jgi:hypothetical protein
VRSGWRNNYVRYRSFFLNVMDSYRRRADLKVYLEIFLSLATISLFAIFALRPTLLTIAELLKEIEGKEDTIKIMDDKITNLQNAQSLYDRERRRIQLLEIAVPDKPSPQDLARQMEGLTLKHQTRIDRFTIDEVTILGKQTTATKDNDEKEKVEAFPANAGEMPFVFEASTSPENYSDIYNFLKDLENLRNPIKIDSFSLLLIEEKNEEKSKRLKLVIDGRLPNFVDNDKSNSNEKQPAEDEEVI